jgi:hypothetical protein
MSNMTILKKSLFLIFCLLIGFSINFAVAEPTNSPAELDTTPPPAEDVLTPEQTPPLTVLNPTTTNSKSSGVI